MQSPCEPTSCDHMVTVRYLSGDEVSLRDCVTIRDVRARCAVRHGLYSADILLFSTDVVQLEDDILAPSRVQMIAESERGRDARTWERVLLSHAAINDELTVSRAMSEMDCEVGAAHVAGKALVRHLYALTPARGDCVVTLLLDAKADLTATTEVREGSNTALHCACADGLLELVSQLINAGASLLATNHYGRTPLREACANGHSAVAQMLLLHPQATAAIGIPCCNGHTALHDACAIGHVDLVRQLLCAQAHVDHEGHGRRTPLALACANGRPQVAELLLQGNADVHHVDMRGATALHMAALAEANDVLSCLLRHGANPEIWDHADRLPLHIACAYGCEKNAALLAAACPASVAMTNPEGHTAVHIASSAGYRDLARILSQAPGVLPDERQRWLLKASVDGDLELCEVLLDLEGSKGRAALVTMLHKYAEKAIFGERRSARLAARNTC